MEKIKKTLRSRGDNPSHIAFLLTHDVECRGSANVNYDGWQFACSVCGKCICDPILSYFIRRGISDGEIPIGIVCQVERFSP